MSAKQMKRDKTLPTHVYDIGFKLANAPKQRLVVSLSADRRAKAKAKTGVAMTVFAFDVTIDGQTIIGWESRSARGFLSRMKGT